MRKLKIRQPKFSIGLPKWVIDLKPGIYTISTISRLSGQSFPNVLSRMELLGIKPELMPFDKYCKKIDTNAQRSSKGSPGFVKVYEWKGAVYHLNKINKERIKKIKGE